MYCCHCMYSSYSNQQGLIWIFCSVQLNLNKEYYSENLYK